MSGWYIERLLLDNQKIRQSVINDSLSLEFGDVPYITSQLLQVINTDLYDDLLSAEIKINQLYKKGTINDEDLEILSYVITNKSFSELSRKYGVGRETISKRFKQLCLIIAFSLGKHFTNDGYLKQLRKKYYLSEEDIIIADMYINNKFKYRSNRSNKDKKNVQK